MTATLLCNGHLLNLSPPGVALADLRIEQDKIVDCGKNLMRRKDEHVHDLQGNIVMPGFVNAHTHLYSSLARGMPGPKSPPRNFLEILKNIWWKLDRALDEESIYYSALVGAIEAVQCGTTTLIDHHASPNCIPGSLDIIREAVQRVGLRAVLCYEVTDRGGKKERDRGLEENERFLRASTSHTHFRGMVGAHASFTLSDDSLRLCGQMAASHQTGVHIHVAEDGCDVENARKSHSAGVVDRLRRHEILNQHSVLAHCIHLVPREFRALHKAECWLVHNPRSNMNNNVGHAPVQLFGEQAALGTDGFPADMFEEAKFGFFRSQEEGNRLAARGLRSDDKPMTRFLSGGHRLVSEIFREKFGTFEKGAVADLIVLDYDPPTPMTKDNVAWHFLFGMRSSMVESVMVGGKWTIKDRKVLGVAAEEAYEMASKAATKLWRRMEG